MPEERRGAARYRVPLGLSAEINGIAVRVLDLSLIGARVEHEERFPLASPQLRVKWRGRTVNLPVRVVRSEIVGRRDARLIYSTGLNILSSDSDTQEAISSILRDPASSPVPTEPVPASPRPPAPVDPMSLNDTWIRQVRFLTREPDDDLPYARFRLTATGWEKDYVPSFEQPSDGFTIPRERHDFDELQRTYETADPETRRMMQIALESLIQLTQR